MCKENFYWVYTQKQIVIRNTSNFFLKIWEKNYKTHYFKSNKGLSNCQHDCHMFQGEFIYSHQIYGSIYTASLAESVSMFKNCLW